MGQGIKSLVPWGVDVAGGVEGDVKGIKDRVKVDAFMRAAREIE